MAIGVQNFGGGQVSEQEVNQEKSQTSELKDFLDKNKYQTDVQLFFTAIREENLAAARFCIEERGVDVHESVQYGFSALTCAVSEGKEEMVYFLITECQVDVNRPDGAGYRPLSRAVAKDDEELVRMLIEEFGADASLIPEGDKNMGCYATPLTIATYNP